MLAYQLPSCVQFVYADMNQAELDRLPRRVVPGTEHIPAARAHRALRDRAGAATWTAIPSWPRNLRLEAERVVEGWLPPDAG